MTEFVSSGGPLPHIPDNLTLTQFIFNSTHECRPVRPQGVPWLVEDATGRKIGLEEVTMVFLLYTSTHYLNPYEDSNSGFWAGKCVELEMGHTYVSPFLQISLRFHPQINPGENDVGM
jgi:hypothetical protein